jgi:inosose dehydratase
MNLAVNPLQWLATEDGWLDFQKAPPLSHTLAHIARSGFDAVMTDVPAGMSAQEYLALLADYGLAPAPGYYSAPLEDTGRRKEIVETAKQRAGLHHELALETMFVASNMSPQGRRVARPARGASPDAGRLAEIAETLLQIGTTVRSCGVTACLHQHVGSWIETEDELEWLLERLDPELVALGPDTGHLAWANIDPLAFVERHRDRIRALHVKDVRLAVAERHRDDGASYREVVQDGLWVEPGRGDLELQRILEALDNTSCTWAIVEVDSPDLPTPEESVAFCGDWAKSASAW